MEAHVLYDYVARGSDELTIKQGDTIKDVSFTNMDGWFSGSLEGWTGIFPGNFVEIVEVPDYPPPSPPSAYSSSSSTELRTNFLFPAHYNQVGSVVAEEDEWWKEKLKGEVEVFAPPSPKRVPTIRGTEKAVMLGRSNSISDPMLYVQNKPIHITQSFKRVAIVKPMSPEGITPVPHTTSEERAAERVRQAQQVSKLDPVRIQTMEEKLRRVFSGANGPTGNFVRTGNSNLPSNMVGENDLARTDTDGAFDQVSNFQMKRGRTVSEVTEREYRDEPKKVSATSTCVFDLVNNIQMKRGRTVSEIPEMGYRDEHENISAPYTGTIPTPGPFIEPKASANHHHQSRIRQDPIPKKEEFEKQTNVRRHSSMSGKTAMMTMFEDMMMRGEQGQIAPLPNYPSHQTNALDDRDVASRRGGWSSGSSMSMMSRSAASQRGVGPPTSSSNYANIFKDNPRNISSSMSLSATSYRPAPPHSHTKPRPSLGSSYSTPSYSTRMRDDRWKKPAEIWNTDQVPPQVPDSSPPRSPPHIQVQNKSGSLSSSSSTAESDSQGRSTLLDGIRKSKLHPVPTADTNDTPSAQRNSSDSSRIYANWKG